MDIIIVITSLLSFSFGVRKSTRGGTNGGFFLLFSNHSSDDARSRITTT